MITWLFKPGVALILFLELGGINAQEPEPKNPGILFESIIIYFVVNHAAKNKINLQCFNNLKDALKKIILDIKLDQKEEHKTILFSPSAASFDSFKNFEDRGEKFNILVQKLNFKKLINV